MNGDEHEGILLAGMAGEEWLRWVAVDVSEPLARARRLRDLTPVAATALGRALSGVALLYRQALRTPERLLLKVTGDGPLGSVVAEISRRRFRGRVRQPQLDNSYFGDRNRRLGAAIGSGTLEVERDGKRGPFRSHSDLVTGEIGSDLAHYLLQSEQTRSVLAVGELLTPQGIAAAGGYLIEALPGTSESILSTLESNLRRAPSWSRSLDDRGLESALDQVLEGLDRSTHERDALSYRCGCDRESLLERLQGLPADDLAELRKASDILAECEYCGAEYRFDASELGDSVERTDVH